MGTRVYLGAIGSSHIGILVNICKWSEPAGGDQANSGVLEVQGPSLTGARDIAALGEWT